MIIIIYIIILHYKYTYGANFIMDLELFNNGLRMLIKK